jgi:hypothetical protein
MDLIWQSSDSDEKFWNGDPGNPKEWPDELFFMGDRQSSLSKACLLGRATVVKWLYCLVFTQRFQRIMLLKKAATSGSVETTRIIADDIEPHSLRFGVYEACRFGNVNVAKFLMRYYPPEIEWRRAFYCACRSTVEMIQWVSQYYTDFASINAWNSAWSSGNLDVIRLVQKEGKWLSAKGWSSEAHKAAIVIAYRFGIPEVIDFAEQYGSDVNYALEGACWGSQWKLIKHLEKYKLDWDYGMRGACSGANPSIISYVVDKGAKKCGCGEELRFHLI